MPRDYQFYLDDIILACEKIVRYTRNISYEDFFQNELIYDAVLRNLLVIGEAAKSLPDTIKNRFNQIEWKKISGLRDLIAHAYFGIDNAILWNVIQSKIPTLLIELQKSP